MLHRLVVPGQASPEQPPASRRDPNNVYPPVALIATAAHQPGRLQPVQQPDHRVGVDGPALAQRRLSLPVLLNQYRQQAELPLGQPERFQPTTQITNGRLVDFVHEEADGTRDSEGNVLASAARHWGISLATTSYVYV